MWGDASHSTVARVSKSVRNGRWEVGTEVGTAGLSKVSTVLIVEDDVGVARAVSRVLPHPLTPLVVRTVVEARAALDTALMLVGAVVDIGLPDGSGLDVVQMLRSDASKKVPVVVLTGLLNADLVNQVTALGAQYVCKPDFALNLASFFETLTSGQAHDELVLAALARSTREHRLTKREADILSHALRGVPRGHLAEVLGISENTVKKYVRSLLDKTNQTSLSETVWMVRVLADMDSRSGSGNDVG